MRDLPVAQLETRWQTHCWRPNKGTLRLGELDLARETTEHEEPSVLPDASGDRLYQVSITAESQEGLLCTPPTAAARSSRAQAGSIPAAPPHSSTYILLLFQSMCHHRLMSSIIYAFIAVSFV
ncbi:SNF-related serine/threonine-protein kinase-like protein [Lates japonicus]|uniref:SNF-related serine/threonine-protein kinase-like protein n=1 Tax=Lates japonicus TaxID=270547 RepID=A0AAD3MQK4_LATJO|nr:SNF-related serine/threonine-protein kinase-like protein [Lates japonicus]